MASTEGQQHPLGIYFQIWTLLFVLSAASYAVDYFAFQGYLRWFLIIVFMMLKAGLIVSVFMHMMWERQALVYAIIVPPLLLLVFVGIGTLEGDYTFLTRDIHWNTKVASSEHRRNPCRLFDSDRPPRVENGLQAEYSIAGDYQGRCLERTVVGLLAATWLQEQCCYIPIWTAPRKKPANDKSE